MSEFSGERRVHTYRYLLSAARDALERAESVEAAHPQLPAEYNSIAVSVLCFGSIEALVNEISEWLIPEFDPFAKTRPKFQALVKSLGLDPGDHRFRCFAELRGIRNGWLHGSRFVRQVIPGQTDPNIDPEFEADPQWFAKCTPPQAKRFLGEAEILIAFLEEKNTERALKTGKEDRALFGALQTHETLGPASPPNSI